MARLIALRNDQRGHQLSYRFGPRPSERRLCLLAPLDDAAVLVHTDDGIERSVEHDARARLGVFAIRELRLDRPDHVVEILCKAGDLGGAADVDRLRRERVG